jgi:uncharacterized repeat protein (TIGR03803 family)
MRIQLLTAAALLVGATHALAAPERSIYSFQGGTDGGFPNAGLIADASGNFYGTTTSDGTGHNGVVYKLTPPAAGKTKWTETVLYAFTGGNDGGDPEARLLIDQKGALYGTTYQGGKKGLGVVFKVSQEKDGTWKETVLHQFTGKADGGAPWSTLIGDANGNLYGTASQGGSGVVGVVFELSPPSGPGGWTETVLYNFTGNNDGGEPYGNLVFGSDGALYGTSVGYGQFNYGTIYRLVPQNGAWTFELLHAFTGGADGSTPRDGMISGPNGSFYGTSAGFDNSQGTVFQLTPPKSGGDWTETPLYAFNGAGFTGNGPWATVSMDASGALYGTTLGVGNTSNGEVFKLTETAKNVWKATVLHGFKGGKNGQFPYSTVLIGAGGTLYGTAEGVAGQSGFYPGVVWKITQ